jgi:hypothetical protein
MWSVSGHLCSLRRLVRSSSWTDLRYLYGNVAAGINGTFWLNLLLLFKLLSLGPEQDCRLVLIMAHCDTWDNSICRTRLSKIFTHRRLGIFRRLVVQWSLGFTSSSASSKPRLQSLVFPCINLKTYGKLRWFRTGDPALFLNCFLHDVFLYYREGVLIADIDPSLLLISRVI